MKNKTTMTVQSNFDALVAGLPYIGQFVNSVSIGNFVVILLSILFFLVGIGYIPAPWVTHEMMKLHMQRIEYLAKKAECRHETDKTKQQECWTELSKLIDTNAGE